MKEYAFETVLCNEGSITSKTTKHRDAIIAYAEKGYRYVGLIPTEVNGYGKYIKIDLIFEKDV